MIGAIGIAGCAYMMIRLIQVPIESKVDKTARAALILLSLLGIVVVAFCAYGILLADMEGAIGS